MTVFTVAVILFVLLVVAVVVAVHYRAQAIAALGASSRTDISIRAIPDELAASADKLAAELRAGLDAKFGALGRWLVAELAKAPAAPVASDAVPSPPAAPSAPSTPEPSSESGGTSDPVDAKIAEIDATTKALQDHRAKLVAARNELEALL